MSTKVEASTMQQSLLYSPLMTFYTLLAAVVIGSSLLEFNELLFPPKVSSINFWALLPIYVIVLDGWFGVVSWSRRIPYTDKPVQRAMIMVLVLIWIVVLALMFFASRAPVSLFSYLWGLVVFFILINIIKIIRIIRTRMTGLPEPTKTQVTCILLTVVTAITYSVWAFAYPPIPTAVNWVFVAMAFCILVGWRVWLKLTHTWRPEEKHQS
jgi:hypothetical protein